MPLKERYIHMNSWFLWDQLGWVNIQSFLPWILWDWKLNFHEFSIFNSTMFLLEVVVQGSSRIWQLNDVEGEVAVWWQKKWIKHRFVMKSRCVPFFRLEIQANTLPETNRQFASENRPGPKRKLVFQPSIFRFFSSDLLVSGRIQYLPRLCVLGTACFFGSSHNFSGNWGWMSRVHLP